MAAGMAGVPAIDKEMAPNIFTKIISDNEDFPPPPFAFSPWSSVTTPPQRVVWKWSRTGNKVWGGGGNIKKLGWGYEFG